MMKTTRMKNGKVLGVEEWQNLGTGEVTKTQTLIAEQTDANFKKIWLTHILDAIDDVGGARLKFLFWLMDNADRQNRIIGTYRAMAEDADVGVATVARLMVKLVKCDIIRKEAQSVHRLNPDIVFQGNSKTRMDVLIRYRNIRSDQPELPLDEAMPDDAGSVVPLRVRPNKGT